MYITNRITRVNINYSITNPNEFEVYVGNDIYVNKNLWLFNDKFDLVQSMLEKTINVDSTNNYSIDNIIDNRIFFCID